MGQHLLLHIELSCSLGFVVVVLELPELNLDEPVFSLILSFLKQTPTLSPSYTNMSRTENNPHGVP